MENLNLIISLSYFTAQPLFQKNELLDFSRGNYPNLLVYDLDNFSDGISVQSITDVFPKAEKILVLIQSEENAQLGTSLSFWQKLARERPKTEIIALGDIPQLQKILIPFREMCTQIESSEQIKLLVQEWLHRL